MENDRLRAWHTRYQPVNQFLQKFMGMPDRALDRNSLWHAKYQPRQSKRTRVGNLKMDVQEEENGAERRS
jgi:hypothetical protein